VETEVEQLYIAGKVVENSWGYDQTNIDYYMITKRNGQWVWLVPMTYATCEDTGFLQGKCTPGQVKAGIKPFRRKVHVWQGQEQGIAIKSYGWCSLWDGKPSHWTAYA
jgi:hypothetical protein